MGYVFQHIFECLLLAGLLGGLIGWLMRGFGFNQKFVDLESEWSRRLGLANDETSSALAKVKASEADASGWKTKFVTIDGDYGKLKTSFADVSAKIPALETAIAGWTAKAASWDADKAKMQADLAACADARGRLETEVKSWISKSAAWDTQRADMTAKLASAAGFDAMVAKLRGQQTSLEADKSALAAQLKKIQAEHDHAVNVYKLAIENEKKLRAGSAEHDGLIAQLRAQLAKVQAEHDHAVNVYKLAIDNEKSLRAGAEKSAGDHGTFIAKAHADYAALEARFKRLQTEHDHALNLSRLAVGNEKKSNAEHDELIARLRSETGILETRLHDMQLERDQAIGKVNRAAADYASEHDKVLATVTDLRGRLTTLEGERNNWLTERTSWLAERGDWSRKYTALEGRLAESVQTVQAVPVTLAATASGESVITHASRPAGDIEDIQGIGAFYGEKLRAVKIAWIKDLLEAGSTPDGRKLIGEQTGIAHTLILKWVNQADLMRVSGVTPNFAELLEASGVDTVKELRHRVPANLQAKLQETRLSQTYKVDVPVPDVDTVARWIEIAKTLTPKLTY